MDDTPQAPLGSGFGFSSTAREVLGGRLLVGTQAVVTGGYAGIGLETTRVLAAAGATVIVPVRSPAKARAALAGVDGVELLPMDLADPASIDAFAAQVRARARPIHLLVNDAGIMAAPLARDARGFESEFATNHLGHFQLTARLWPALADGARVISLSSRGHQRSAVDLDDRAVGAERGVDGGDARGVIARAAPTGDGCAPTRASRAAPFASLSRRADGNGALGRRTRTAPSRRARAAARARARGTASARGRRSRGGRGCGTRR